MRTCNLQSFVDEKRGVLKEKLSTHVIWDRNAESYKDTFLALLDHFQTKHRETFRMLSWYHISPPELYIMVTIYCCF